MAKEIKIAELSIDTKQLLTSLKDTKASIEALTNTQKALKASGEQNTEAFIKNEASLKSLKGEYNNQIKVLQATTDANSKLTSELAKEITSVDAAAKNNKALKTVRNQLNTETVEGAKALNEINEKIDKNNDYIKENASALEQQKINIGDYKNGIKDAFNELNIFNGGLSGFIGRSNEAGGAGNLIKTSLGGMAKGFLGLAKASLAFIATPIGAVLAAIVGAFALVKNAMNRSEDSTNKIKKAFSAFSGIVKGVLKVLEPVGKFLIDGLVKGFELVEKGVFKAMNGIASGLKLLGFDDAAKSFQNFTNELENSSKSSKALADAEAQLTKIQRTQGKVQLDAQKEAEKLRQIRDDETKTMAERIKANEDLGESLQKQLAAELAIANKALEVAKLRLLADGESNEALDAQAAALTTISDIQERITGQESEQLVNKVALYKEAGEKAKENAQKAIDAQQAELDKYIESQGIKKKTLQEQLDFQNTLFDKEKALLDKQLKNKLISQTQYDTEILKLQNGLAQTKADLAVENAQKELTVYIDNNLSKLDSDKFFTEQALIEEQARLDGIAEKRKEFEATQLAEGIINKTEYDAAIKAIDDETKAEKDENDKARKEAQKTADAIDRENRIAINSEFAEYDLNTQLENLENAKRQELENAEKTGADKKLIEEKYADAEKKIKQNVTDAKLEMSSTLLSGLSNLLGKESAAGKAAAVAQATIDTYLGANKAIATYPPPFGQIAAGITIATGLLNVKKILATKPPKIDKAERGVLLSGARHSEGGIHIEAEDGEAIINRKSTSKYLPLLSAINQSEGGVPFMASGGIAGSVKAPSSLIDYDTLAAKMSAANASLPAPVVSVNEINSVANRVAVIERQATF